MPTLAEQWDADVSPELRGLNPDLADRLQQAKDAYKKQYGKDMASLAVIVQRRNKPNWQASQTNIRWRVQALVCTNPAMPLILAKIYPMNF